MTNTTVGQTIREQREKLGMTQEQLANKLGITKQAISRWEQDLCRPSEIPQVCNVLQIAPNELLAIDSFSRRKRKRNMNDIDLRNIKTFDDFTHTVKEIAARCFSNRNIDNEVETVCTWMLETAVGYCVYMADMTKEDLLDLYSVTDLLGFCFFHPADKQMRSHCWNLLDQKMFRLGGEVFEDFGFEPDSEHEQIFYIGKYALDRWDDVKEIMFDPETGTTAANSFTSRVKVVLIQISDDNGPLFSEE